VTWEGGHRPAIDGRGVYPRPEREIPVWIAVGGTPQSVARAGALGLPLAIAIIGGEPARFAPLAKLYRDVAAQADQAPDVLRVGINVHGFVADTREAAEEAFWPPYRDVMTRIGRERGWPPLTREQYEAGMGPGGHLFVGDVEAVADKIVRLHRLFGQDRFLMQMSLGPMPRDALLRSIALFGEEVAPRVRAALSDGRATQAASAP
jgi:alkanesulfonate monooxygenase SsuD/methylene tetrahydromethanopterin reductase-like flavin-dependent oxidoreductase (luciferase family)